MKCVYCGEKTAIIIGDETDDEYVCSKCLERYFTSCSDCGVWVHNDDIRTVISEGFEVYVCEQCCKNSYTFCEECGEYVRNEEGTYSTYDRQWRCYECLDNSMSFICCESCDTYYRERDVTYSESREEYLCPNCYEEDEEVTIKQ